MGKRVSESARVCAHVRRRMRALTHAPYHHLEEVDLSTRRDVTPVPVLNAQAMLDGGNLWSRVL